MRRVLKPILLSVMTALLLVSLFAFSALAEENAGTGTAEQTESETETEEKKEPSAEAGQETAPPAETEKETETEPAAGTTPSTGSTPQAGTDSTPSAGTGTTPETEKKPAVDPYQPSAVTKLNVKSGTEVSVILSWPRASKATGYLVYQQDTVTKRKKSYITSKLTFTSKNMTMVPGRYYKFYVYAYNKIGGKTRISAKSSPVILARTFVKKPGKATNLRVTTYTTTARTFAWNAAKDATGYAIYMYNTASGKYTKIAETAQRKYTVRGLKESDKQYSFKVMAFREIAGVRRYGDASNGILAKVHKISITTVHGWYLKAEVRSDTVAKLVSTGQYVSVPGGTTVTATDYKRSGNVEVILSNNKLAVISADKLTYGNLVITGRKYTREQAENFINTAQYSSKTDYLIWVNQYTCIAFVFKGKQGAWELVREMDCVVGGDRSTPPGLKTITSKGEAWGDVAVFFGGNAFHRRWATKRGAESHGCVRLGTSDLHYVYDNVPVGTRIVFY